MSSIGVFAVITDNRGHLLCVHHGYGDRHWTLPGGGVEAGESPIEALEREVREETGIELKQIEFVGAYAAPWKDDLVLSFRATVARQGPWTPNDEITEIDWFEPTNLPQLFSSRALVRIQQALAGTRSHLHVFDQANSASQ